MSAVPRWKHYGLAAVAVGAAMAPVWAFGEALIWLVLAVVASTLYSGIGPGLVAASLSVGALVFLPSEPHLLLFLAAALSGVAIVEGRRWIETTRRQAAETHNIRQNVDSVPGMVYTMTASGDTEFFNSRVTTFLGKTSEELKDWAPLLHPEDRDLVMAAWMRSVETWEPFDVEHRARCADGNYRWLKSQGLPMFDGNGRVVRWYNQITDIDGRKRAEAALRASELNFRTIVESIPGMVGTVTPDGELEFANGQLLDFLGATHEELRNWPPCVHPEDRPRVVALYRTALETGEHVDFECRIRRADGVHRWMHYRGIPHRDAGGRITRRYFLITDIEELKQAEADARANELKFRLTIDNIPGMAFTCTNA